ncbi:Uncharacterized protein TCM_024808 [Theobroma cacao]|uniref:Uncharacterized protein n=1 Tax=Theobroma cacao TaxID=3641 RepID=A0A061F4B0_THECC|nr:Uncharacterized protein TCM_024808 [Theobroma cacao]
MLGMATVPSLQERPNHFQVRVLTLFIYLSRITRKGSFFKKKQRLGSELPNLSMLPLAASKALPMETVMGERASQPLLQSDMMLNVLMRIDRKLTNQAENMVKIEEKLQ